MENHPTSPEVSDKLNDGLAFIKEKRPLAPLTFGIILLLFSFSFVDFKCTGGQKIASLTGMDLAFGGKPNIHMDDSFSDFGMGDQEEMTEGYAGFPDIWALLALLGVVGGIITYFYKGSFQTFNAFGLAAAGISLFGLTALRWNYNRQIKNDPEIQGMVYIEFTNTYWAAVFLLYVLLAITVYRIMQPDKSNSVSLE